MKGSGNKKHEKVRRGGVVTSPQNKQEKTHGRRAQRVEKTQKLHKRKGGEVPPPPRRKSPVGGRRKRRDNKVDPMMRQRLGRILRVLQSTWANTKVLGTPKGSRA